MNANCQVARIDIAPAEQEGQSWLDITLQSRAPINGSLGADNSGTHEEVGGGLYRASADVSVRGIGAETWSLGTTQRLFFNGHDDVEDSANIALGIPLGFWNIDLRHSRSRYEKAIHSFYGSYDSRGDSRDDSLKISRAFDRSRRGKSNVFLRINHKDSNNYIEGKRIDVNSKRYTDLALGLSRVDQLWGGSLYADINLGRGTPWLGANYTKPHVFDETPAMYTKWSGNLSWNRGFQIAGRPFEYALRGGWQYSTHAMLGANKLTIGDEYTVRGYKGNSVFGDRGVYVSNTLTAPLAGGLSAFVGLDAGAVEDNDVRAVRQSITGAALGVRMRLPNGGNLAFTSATPLGAERSQESVVYASVQFRF